jgi:hypothetical protein
VCVCVCACFFSPLLMRLSARVSGGWCSPPAVLRRVLLLLRRLFGANKRDDRPALTGTSFAQFAQERTGVQGKEHAISNTQVEQ